MQSVSQSFFGNPAFAALACVVVLFGLARGDWLKFAALAFFAVWFLYRLSYTAYSPSLALRSFGIPLMSNHLWAMTDLGFGLLCITLGLREFAGWALWALTSLQEIMHTLYWEVHVWDKATYYGALDNSWLVMVAVFLVAGGPSVFEHINSSTRLRSFRSLRRAVSRA